ncbi:hypothetical protein IEQ34_016194 [Dendrobium chrysotoxum]|uniref:Uncharacterized protein n=1 Tax=Dendrobium chrysotoxum TaxID=161865 RepID=A0AAV7GDG7_DENCH|nr:hypothetical protein IEQ34_016194 [Dendrobium chrysotoxum]
MGREAKLMSCVCKISLAPSAEEMMMRSANKMKMEVQKSSMLAIITEAIDLIFSICGVAAAHMQILADKHGILNLILDFIKKVPIEDEQI